jgi:hypothetical protein
LIDRAINSQQFVSKKASVCVLLDRHSSAGMWSTSCKTTA